MSDRAALFNEHRSRLYGIAYRMLGSRADAEDMVQETYLRWHRADIERLQVPQALARHRGHATVYRSAAGGTY